MTRNSAASKSDWTDPGDAPELTDECFDKATFTIGRKVIRRGRRPGATKTQIALRVDNEVLAAFRSGRPGWQSR
jgi:uncharacterized protein (DUF4415 family)